MNPRNKEIQRNKKILELWVKGETCKAIAQQFGVAPQRIDEIIKRDRTDQDVIQRTLNDLKK